MNWSKVEPRVGENIIREDGIVCRYTKQSKERVGANVYALLNFACGGSIRVKIVASTAFFPTVTKRGVTCLQCAALSK